MAYLKNHLEKKEDPKLLLKEAKSVICCALNYKMESQNPRVPRIGHALISNYAWGEDYHLVMKRKLKQLLREVQGVAPEVEGRVCVDTAPILERAYAEASGIGWVGKNTMVLNREYGSYLFLGEILLTCELAYDAPVTDHCGTCTRCLEVCPTGALLEAFVLDARKCISYLTIEKRGSFTEEQKLHVQDYVFGCDICQVVCPWNGKAEGSDVPEFKPKPHRQEPSLEWLSNLKPDEFKQHFHHSALQRTKFEGLCRNTDAVQHKS